MQNYYKIATAKTQNMTFLNKNNHGTRNHGKYLNASTTGNYLFVEAINHYVHTTSQSKTKFNNHKKHKVLCYPNVNKAFWSFAKNIFQTALKPLSPPLLLTMA